jgi:hypothetical protein
MDHVGRAEFQGFFCQQKRLGLHLKVCSNV